MSDPRSPFSGAADVLAAAGVIEPAPEEKAWVKLCPVLSDLCEQVGLVLGKGGRLWLRGDAVCYLGEDPNNKGVLEFLPMSEGKFRTWVERFISFYHVKHRDGEEVRIRESLSVEVAKTILVSEQFRLKLPRVRRVHRVRLPIFRDRKGAHAVLGEARVLELLRAGYDEESEVYTFANEVEVDEGMSLEAGVGCLLEVLSETRFAMIADEWEGEQVVRACPRSVGVQVAAMVGLFVNGLVPRWAQRMGFMFTANAPGAGKSTLAKLATAPVLGTVEAITWSKDEEALRTRVDSWMLSGRAALFFDNVKDKIDSGLLEALMTLPTHTLRLFHTQRMATVPNETTVLITGNNAEASSDANRRFLYVELDQQAAEVRDDVRRLDLSDRWMLDPVNRGRILSALWALVRAWDAAGRPGPVDREGKRVRGVVGFGDWCDLVGGIVTTCTRVSRGAIGNPFAAPELRDSGDKESRDLRKLLELLVTVPAEEGMRAAVDGGVWEGRFEDLVLMAMEHGLFAGMLPELPEGKDVSEVLDKSQRAKFATFINKRSGEKVEKRKSGIVYSLKLEGGVGLWRFSYRGSGRHKRFLLERE